MFVASLLSCVLLAQHVYAAGPLVDVSYTKYQGTALGTGITQWLGIRFAAPPLGSLRFAAPQDPLPNAAVQVADEHGPICLGTGKDLPANESSEDCLFLDVYAPSSATPASKLPVYFFIQGGGFNDNSNPNYNGSGLIQASGMNIVVVTFNYRVGPYGFLASQEVLRGGATNNGLRDQRKALQWVQSYIALFGGDPGHVTMGGDSAGAASVNLQLTAYAGRNDNLFHATTAESQSFAAIRTVPESQYQYDNLVIRVGCASSPDTLSCLRSINSTALQLQNVNTPFPGSQKAPLYMYGPVLDYDFVTDYTYSAYASGNFIQLPAIYGDVTNEGTIFTPNSTANISASHTFLQDQFPGLGAVQLAKITELYPISEQFNGTGAYWRQVSNAYGEIRYICPGIFISKTYSRLGLARNWNYHWDVRDPKLDKEGFGVTHTVEVNAIFGPENVNGGAPASYSTTNKAIVPVMQGYWTSFIRAYDPNVYRAAGSPVWENWDGVANVTAGATSAGVNGPYGWNSTSTAPATCAGLLVTAPGNDGGYQRLYLRTNATAMESVPLDQRNRCEFNTGMGGLLKQ